MSEHHKPSAEDWRVSYGEWLKTASAEDMEYCDASYHAGYLAGLARFAEGDKEARCLRITDGDGRDISGETYLGLRVAAWRETIKSGDQSGHVYSEHWSTPGQFPKDLERLFTESQLSEVQARATKAEAELAERDRANEQLHDLGDKMHAQKERALAQLARAQEALQFYADGFHSETYDGEIYRGSKTQTLNDGGQRARAALSELEGREP